MNIVKTSIVFFWSVIQIKKLLFWSYLWQLKEYHWGRMRSYLKTRQGLRVTLFSPLKWIKLLLLAGFFYFPLPEILSLPLGFILAFEALLFSYKWSRKKALRPVFTKRILTTLGLGLFLIFIWAGAHFYFRTTLVFIASLVFFDITAFFFFSLVVLTPQPLVSIWRKKLINMSTRKRKQLRGLRVVGITGSYGKSSVKDFLAEMLSQKYKTLKTERSQNSTIGIADAILNKLNQEHEFFVCEIGAYKKGEVKEMAEMVDPHLGVLTGINEQHLATFGSLENIIQGKFEIVEVLPPGGTAVVNGDNDLIRSRLQAVDYELKILKCSAGDTGAVSRGSAELWPEAVKIKQEEVSFDMVSKAGDRVRVKLGLVGEHNIINFLMAAGAARELGVDCQQIAQAAKNIEAAESGIRIREGRAGVSVLDDTYSANPHGVKAALEHLELWPGEKVVVMPCLIELGKESKRVHQEIGEAIGRVCDLAVITSPDFLDPIRRGVKKAGMESDKVLFLNKPKSILKKLEPFLREGNVILLESRVPESLLKALTEDL